MKTLKKWSTITGSFLLHDIPAAMFWWQLIKGEIEVSAINIIFLCFLCIYPFLFAFLVYKLWEFWETNKVLMRKINTLRKIEEHDLTVLSDGIKEAFNFIGNSAKDAVQFYQKNPTGQWNQDGMIKTMNSMIKRLNESNNQRRFDLVKTFDNESY